MAPTPYPIKIYHRWGNFFLWGILADVGIVFASYNKSQRGTTIHQYIMLFLVLNSLISSLAYCYLKPYNYTYDSFSKLSEYKQDHLIYGTALMILMVLLSLFGYIVKLQLSKYEASKYLILYKKVHTVGGHIIYFIGKYESFLGMYMSYGTQSWFIVIWIIYIFIFIARLALIYVKPYFSKSKLYSELQENQKVNFQSLSTDLKDKQWCIFKDQVFVMKDEYIHPGGQLIWKHLKCIEIGQYFYGITQLPGTNILHYHSNLAFAQLQTCFYGQLINNINFPKNENFEWEIKNTQKITESVYRFDFSHPQIEFEINLSHCTPNHFVLKTIQSTKTPTRLYTYIQCMQKPSLEYMERVGQLFDKKENARLSNNFKCTSLSFYIKYYNTPNGMSKYLTQQQPQQMRIEGPYQTVFNQYIEDGQIILICGGTGILPFLDLLNHHLLMTYNQLLNNPNLIYVPKNQRYITLFYSISSEEEMIGDHIFLRLRELQQYLQIQNFTLILKCRKPIERCDTVKSRFTKEFITKYLKETNRQFYVCGPQILRNSISSEFKEIENEIIYL